MPSAIDIRETEMPGVLEIRHQVFSDDRGYFTESYNRDIWTAAGFTQTFSQDSLSLSHKGVLRGMHYQLAPHGMGKLIRVVTGAVYDVVVDLRQGAPTFGRWLARELTENHPMWLFAPVGFAHGYLSLCDNTHVYYKCTNCHAMDAERSLRYNDPAVGINWPKPPVVVSAKDATAPLLADAEYNFVF